MSASHSPNNLFLWLVYTADSASTSKDDFATLVKEIFVRTRGGSCHNIPGTDVLSMSQYQERLKEKRADGSYVYFANDRRNGELPPSPLENPAGLWLIRCHGCHSTCVSLRDTKDHLEEECTSFLLRRTWIVITGVPGGLQSFLAADIVLAAVAAGLTDTEQDAFVERVGRASAESPIDGDDGNSMVRFVGNRVELVLLLHPSLEFFERTLLSYFNQTPMTEISLWYCGHGSPHSGAWQLLDGALYGHEFAELLVSMDVEQYIELAVYVNACHAFDFCQDVHAGLFAATSGDAWNNQFVNFVTVVLEKYKNEANKATMDLLIEFLKDGFPKEHAKLEEVHELFCKTALDAFIQTTYGALTPTTKAGMLRQSSIGSRQHLSVRPIPFSCGPLSASGVLPELLNPQGTKLSRQLTKAAEDVTRASGGSRRKPPQEASPEKYLPKVRSSETIDLLSCADAPVVHVFQAGCGGSALLRYKDTSLLVDGGLFASTKKPPCYWKTIASFPEPKKLSCVVLTHGDDDHVKGLLPLIFADERDGLDYVPRVEKVLSLGYDTTQVPALSEWTRTWFQGALFFAQTLNKQVGWKAGEWITIEDVKIMVITPDEHMRKDGEERATDAVRKGVDATKAVREKVTPINVCSIALLVKIQHENRERPWLLLFTGDAKAEDIVGGLKQHASDLWEDGRFKVDYSDVPHHGSDHNDPKKFFDAIESPRFVISTDGKRHGHPHPLCLKLMNELPIETDIIFPCEEVLTYPDKLRKKPVQSFLGDRAIHGKKVDEGISFAL